MSIRGVPGKTDYTSSLSRVENLGLARCLATLSLKLTSPTCVTPRNPRRVATGFKSQEKTDHDSLRF